MDWAKKKGPTEGYNTSTMGIVFLIQDDFAFVLVHFVVDSYVYMTLHPFDTHLQLRYAFIISYLSLYSDLLYFI